MANQLDPRAAFGGTTAARSGAVYDEGLRSYMLSIYNYMASGVLLTGLVSLFVANNEATRAIFFAATGAPTILGWLAILSPLAMILVMSFGLNRLSEGATKAMFWAYAGLMGISLSTIFMRYTDASIAQTFFVTAAAFGGLSLWGYTTKKNLSGMGTFLMMGLIGLIVAMLANLFFKSGMLQLVINFVGVLIFAGLTAYDTQRLKNDYAYLAGSEFMGKAVVMGALSLYLNFINMFTFLLSIFGNRE
jgi:uncharacterized protein